MNFVSSETREKVKVTFPCAGEPYLDFFSTAGGVYESRT
jgi:hypothetical protein